LEGDPVGVDVGEEGGDDDVVCAESAAALAGRISEKETAKRTTGNCSAYRAASCTGLVEVFLFLSDLRIMDSVDGDPAPGDVGDDGAGGKEGGSVQPSPAASSRSAALGLSSSAVSFERKSELRVVLGSMGVEETTGDDGRKAVRSRAASGDEVAADGVGVGVGVRLSGVRLRMGNMCREKRDG